MKKVVVTGAGGYIGSITAYLLLQKGFEVVAIDNFSNGFKQPLEILQEKFGKDRFRFYKADILDNLSPIFESEKEIEGVLHFAALLSVDESVKFPEKYFHNNTDGTKNLISYLLKYQIKNLVFSSTCAVYGEAQYTPIDENHPTHPSNPYGESKLNTEQEIKSSSLNYVILRYFNVCGTSDDSLIGYSKTPAIHLVQSAVRGALGLQKFSLTCPQVKTPDKTPIRDYINVVDLSIAHLKSLDYLLSGGKDETINLGTGTGNSVLEIIAKVQKITGIKFDLQKTTPRQGEDAKLIASIEKAKKILNWQPERSLEDSIRTLVEWYKVHPNGWDY